MIKKIKFSLTSPKEKFIFFSFLGVIIFYLSKDFGFFHDDILFGSKMGYHLYSNSLFNWNIPETYDPGHPPIFGFILALFWKILGHKLWVSHLVMLPFLVGFFYQLFQFIGHYITHKTHQTYAFLLILIDPTISASLVLVNMEIISMFLFFLTINSIKEKKNILKFLGLFFLSILSIRNMMLFGGIFLFEVLQKTYLEKQKIKSLFNLKFILPYFLGCLPGCTFILWRLLTKGYITNPNSPWAGYGHFVDFNYFLRNCMVLIWRYIDFGRVFIMLFLLFSFYVLGKKILTSKKQKEVLLLAILPVFFIMVTILLITNTVGLRYFIVSYISLNLLSFMILKTFYTKKKIIYILLVTGLLTGNLWVYPKTLSQAWHNTLGHVPYHALRLEAIDYLNKNKINVEKVASFFPNYTTLDLIDFKGDQRSFAKFNGNNNYVFYSNVYNLTDKELNTLDNNYNILKEFNKFNITIKIFILKK